MNKKLYLLYIPGLGDSRVTGQRMAISAWIIWGVQAELFQMRWDDQEPWSSKLRRLLDRIDMLNQEGYKLALVGSSAGASAVINAYAARKDYIVGCVLIAGKVNRPEAIGKRYYLQTPAFVDSVRDCQKALDLLHAVDRQRVLSLYAIADGIVHKSDSRIEGARNRRVPSVGHAFTIATQIFFGAPRFIRFLCREAISA